MIVLLRIDDRIIHGQVVTAWIPHLRIDQVIVVDDEVAATPLMASAMTLALPPGVQGRVIPLDGVEGSLDAADASRTLVVVRGVGEALRIIDAGAQVPRLNLGNLHRREDRVQASPSVFLSDPELEQLEAMAARGIEVEARSLPSDQPLTLEELRTRLQSSSTSDEIPAVVCEGRFQIVNQLGLHARAAAQLVQLANRFPCEISLRREDQHANAKSIMGVLMLAAAQGSVIEVRAEGEKAQQALREIGALIEGGFGEDRG